MNELMPAKVRLKVLKIWSPNQDGNLLSNELSKRQGKSFENNRKKSMAGTVFEEWELSKHISLKVSSKLLQVQVCRQLRGYKVADEIMKVGKILT